MVPFGMDALQRAGITARESEVLALLDRRLTNAEIAEQLYISIRTVESHVSALLTKLGATDRRELGDMATLLLSGTKHNLPRIPTSFVGRDDQLGDLEVLVADNRLSTLVGPPGVGKTRLALEFGLAQLDHYRDGVWLVDLAPLSATGLVAIQMLGTLGGSIDSHRTPLAALVARAQDQECLIVLDNCEHLADEAMEVAEVLATRTKGIRVLATSRQALGSAVEGVMSVTPLPAPDDAVATRNIAGYPSVKLFLDRARSSVPDLDLATVNVETVAAICRRLDGLPLALELAASRLRTFSLDQIVDNLDDRFHILSATRADSRHHTLHAAIEWSYDQLTPRDQTLLTRLGVFVGTFSLGAAESVGSDESISRSEVLESLATLADKSLVQVVPAEGSYRYRLLESIREFAWSRVEDSEVIARRHAEFLVSLTDEGSVRLREPDQLRWQNLIRLDLDNIRRALAWTISAGEHEFALRLLGNLAKFWGDTGRRREGIDWSERILATTRGLASSTHVKALNETADLYLMIDPGRSLDLATSAMDIAGELHDDFRYHEALLTRGAANTFVDSRRALDDLRQSYEYFAGIGHHHETVLILLFMSICTQGSEGFDHLESALEITQRSGDLSGQVDAAYMLATKAAQESDDVDLAEELANRALRLAQRSGGEHALIHARSVLAMVALRHGKVVEARELANELRGAFERVGDLRCWARMTCLLAAASAESDANGAIERYRSALEDAWSVDPATVTNSLDGLTSLEAGPMAIRCAAAAEAVRAKVRAPRSWYIPDPSPRIEELKSEVGDEAFAAAWEEGSRLDIDSLIADDHMGA